MTAHQSLCARLAHLLDLIVIDRIVGLDASLIADYYRRHEVAERSRRQHTREGASQ
jgi:hypothetical protein